MLNMLGGARRVRRTMAPLNDLALRVDELGRMQPSGGKMETLEQAIERASVDSPSVTTGDADLASIEVALNRLLRQMQEAKLQQMRFVNDASHELRTPIAVIQGYVNMLDRWGKDDPDVLAESIASLKAESEHMQELVEQLLFLARGDAGRTVLRRANTNLAALVGEVCEESQMIDTEHTYRLAFDAALVSDPRCDAPVDVALVKQALRVIVQNAAKYSDAGTPITFGVAPDAGAGTIDINVEDEGIGMNQESAAHAFERFYRADNARDAGAQGSGLGLAIAKWIVDSHGGVIGVTSVEVSAAALRFACHGRDALGINKGIRPYGPIPLLTKAACALVAAQVHGEAGELALKVHEFGAAVGQQHARLLVNLEPALGKPLLGRIDVVDGKANVALSATTVLLHDLDQRIVKVRNGGLDDGQAHHRREQLRDLQGVCRVGGVNAHMGNAHAEELDRIGVLLTHTGSAY